MHYRSNFMVLVGGGARPFSSPLKGSSSDEYFFIYILVSIWDDLKQCVRFELSFGSVVRGVEVTRDRLASCPCISSDQFQALSRSG